MPQYAQYPASNSSGSTINANIVSPSPLPVSLPASTTGGIDSVPPSTTSEIILTANSSRKGLSIVNNSPGIMYVAFSATASTSLYTFSVAAGTFYTYNFSSYVYTGVISAIFANNTGSAAITELS